MVVSSQRIVKISKYLSYHLRHRPDLLDLELASGGWVETEKLMIAAEKNNFSFSLTELKTVVEQNDKQRFSFDPTGKFIRANQGHSVAIDLALSPLTPPPILYHGTHVTAVESIMQSGLSKMNRHHVHLSTDLAIAAKVGQRRGKAVVLEIAAGNMTQDGFLFYRSENEVWLVDHVPAKYIKLN